MTGTTYTPSERRYATGHAPQSTHPNVGAGQPLSSNTLTIRPRFLAPSSIPVVPVLIPKAPQLPSGLSMTASISLPLPSR